LTVAGYLLLARRPRTALLLLIGWAGAEGLSNGLKLLFSRPRPDLVPHAVEVTTASLPSGHALLAMAMYLSFAALIPGATSARPVRLYLLVVAVLLALLIGASRIYLGVHWPSDVLAGWAIGGAWAALIWWASQRIGE
jgi:undecaprenyl-diphosphatase